MRSKDEGFVTLAAIIIMVVTALAGTLLYTSLLGETQGEISARWAATALNVAEAGANWGIAKLAGAGAATYAGAANQALQSADGTPVGVFDVTVTCSNGSAAITGCPPPAQSGTRIISATGYAPSKATALGVRTIRILVNQTSALNFNNSICAFTSVNLDQGVMIAGNVGSEGATSPDLTLQGPSGNPAKILAGGGQSGNATAVSTASCSQNCDTQVAGVVRSGQTPGTVCPNRAQVIASFACPIGSQNITSDTIISTATGNTTLNNITVGSGSTVVFATAGPSDVLVVHANSITAGQGSIFRITGGGSVVLTLAGPMHINQSSLFGVDSMNTLLPANHMEVESCSTNTGTGSGGTAAVQFDQGSRISAVVIAPQGSVDINQAQLMGGAILADTVQFDKGTNFSFDNTAGSLGGGFPKLVSWQDVP
jgi:hypothetical protein